MKTNNVIISRVIYSIIMFVLTTTCLVCIIILWYKADKSARWALFIPIALGYAASIHQFVHRKRQ
jgi:ABC-type polysaccharide/polyol phosphate export permease